MPKQEPDFTAFCIYDTMPSIFDLLIPWFHTPQRASLVVENSNAIGDLQKIPSPMGDFESVPLEIVLLITKYLPDVALHSFALTYRPYYHALCGRFPYLKRGGKEELLQLLEKDTSHLFFCHHCVQLHAWRSSWDAHDTWNPPNERKCLHKYSYFTGPYVRKSCIPYHHARVVMNRHLYGASHGLPLRILEHYSLQTDLSYGAILQTSTKARIVNNELFLLQDCKVWHRRGYAPDLRLSIDESMLEICQHLTVYKTESFSEHRIPELERGARGPSLFIACAASVGSCPTCLTDYSITITWRGKDEGWFIHMLIYRQFGSCRSPFDWNWRHMAESYNRNQPRCLTEDPGIVKHRWSQGDSGTLGPIGKFVGRANNLTSYIPGHRRCDWDAYCRPDHDCATFGLGD